MMKVLVVTGGIGSGKSLVCKILKEKYGVPVYDADKRVKALYVEQPETLDKIETDLGISLKDDKGSFVAQRLADVIFNDPIALSKVEDIVFPVLKNDFYRWAEEQSSVLVAFESATILEKPQFEGFGDIVLLVDAPVSIRLSRASVRDGVDQSRIRERMAAQKHMNRISEGTVDLRVDYTIMNDSSEEDLLKKLNEFIEKYCLTKML